MRRSLWLISILMLLTACEANFRDLRPEDAVDPVTRDTGPPSGDADRRDTLSDTEPVDTFSSDDSEVDPGGDAGDTGVPSDGMERDTASDPDTGTDTGGASERLVAEGTFESRDYEAKGTVQLYELPDGSWELRLGSDFEAESTPGPVVVLTRRETMGADIKPDQGDKELGALRSNAGADRYEVPGGPGSRRNAFIFCKPFGGEIGRAIMEAP